MRRGDFSRRRRNDRAHSVNSDIVRLWITLDPEGYLDLLAPEVTYFDPFTERRLDGREAMQVRLAPMNEMNFPFTDPRYDMIDPKIQGRGGSFTAIGRTWPGLKQPVS